MVHKNNYSNGRQRKWPVYVVFVAIGIALGAGYIGYPKVQSYINRIMLDRENEEVMAVIMEEQVLNQTIENIQEIIEGDTIKDELDKAVIMENAYLEVPFVCQAPHQTEANWVFHEESCEEAALLQVQYFLEGVETVNKQKAHEILLDMIAWQEKNFGEHRDIYANEMKDFIKGYYGYEDDDVYIIYDAEITDIKRAISAGYPVIVPIMGDILKNPYYPYPGYHMLTIVGYTPDNIITNDVGTRRGKNFSYSYNQFMKATKAAGGDILIIREKEEIEVEESTDDAIL